MDHYRKKEASLLLRLAVWSLTAGIDYGILNGPFVWPGITSYVIISVSLMWCVAALLVAAINLALLGHQKFNELGE